MKRHIRFLLVLVLLCAATVLIHTGTVYAARVGYISGIGEPWNYVGPSNVWEMNAVFGAGNWDRLTWTSAAALADYSGYDFLFIDGGDGESPNYVSFMATERTQLESWVLGGGSILQQVARWDVAGDINMGFGAILRNGASSTASAVVPTHDIFTNTAYGVAGTSWTGGSFSHDYLVSSPGFSALITGSSGTILAETDWGAGHVMVGGMTLSEFQYPRAAAVALHENILAYGYEQANPVPEPATMLLLGSGLFGLAGFRRRFRKN